MAKNKPKEFKDYLTLDFSAETVLKNLPFILFIGLIGMMYIMNAHYSEKKLWQIQKYEDEIEELKWEYDAIKANLMYQTKQSEVDIYTYDKMCIMSESFKGTNMFCRKHLCAWFLSYLQQIYTGSGYIPMTLDVQHV